MHCLDAGLVLKSRSIACLVTAFKAKRCAKESMQTKKLIFVIYLKHRNT